MIDAFYYAYKYQWVFILAAIPLGFFIIWTVLDSQRIYRNVKISSFKNFEGPSSLASWLVLLPLLKCLAMIFVVVALARPQDPDDETYQEIYSEGIDIVISFDVSASMLAMDFSPNRLEVARDVAIDFIHKRKNDRIGLVIFEGEAFTQCPLTTDKNMLIDQFKLAQPGMVEQGTAIGMGLATAVNRLRESKAKSKVIILLTDGVNNAGNINPATASDIAKKFGIRVYTIGVGKKGKAKYPVPDFFGNITYQYLDVEIDEELLTEIARNTGGEYFRATDKDALQKIYARIDRMERTKVNVVEYRKDPPERFHLFAFIALALLAAELILKNTLFKSPLW